MKFGVGWMPEAKMGLDLSPASDVKPAAPCNMSGAVQDSVALYEHSMMHQKDTLKGAARYDNSMKGAGAQPAGGGSRLDVSKAKLQHHLTYLTLASHSCKYWFSMEA